MAEGPEGIHEEESERAVNQNSMMFNRVDQGCGQDEETGHHAGISSTAC